MKVKFLSGLILILSMHLMGCSGGDDSNVEVVIGKSPYPLIPAPAISCLAYKNASSSAPANDITASYFRMPVITFNRKNTTDIFVVALVRITINAPGSSISCEVGGDGLAALSSTWWSNSTKEAAVPAGTATFQTDCPLYCGGVPVGNTPFTATGILEVFGLERNVTSLEENPVKIQTSISVQNF